MVYSPRQIVVRAREAASLLLGALERERMVVQFLDSYAAEQNRPRVKAHVVRYRELAATLGREALLAMVMRMDQELPRRLAVRPRARKRGPKSKAVDLFREEFLVTLGESLEWENDELAEFCRDLDLFKRLAARELRWPKPRKPAVGGPFVDRVGILLDPVMLEKARRAAARFQFELDATVERILNTIFAGRRKN